MKSVIMNSETKRKVYKQYRLSHSAEENNKISDYASFERDEPPKPRSQRKELIKDYSNLTEEYQIVCEQNKKLQDALTKRDGQILKIKEKFRSLKTHNKDLKIENANSKSQNQELTAHLEQITLKFNEKCVSCTDLKKIIKNQNGEMENTKKMNKDLHLDLNMLKNVIYRLNLQLQRYQEKLTDPIQTATPPPMEDASESQSNELITHSPRPETHATHSHTPIAWGDVNSHTLGPLLDAYQDTIAEKDDIIQNYEQQLTNFNAKLKCIIKENEILHRKQIENEEQVKNNNLDLEKQRKEMKAIRDQNDLLIKKCAIKQDKFQQICQVYDRKLNTLKNDFEVLQNEYHNSRVEFSSLQGKYNRLNSDYEVIKKENRSTMSMEMHTAQINECKSLFEELKQKYESEKQKLEAQVKFGEEEKMKLAQEVGELTANISKNDEKLKQKNQILKKSEQKIFELKRILTQTQISRDACKRQLKKAVEFGRELINDQDRLTQQLSDQSKEHESLIQKDSQTSNQLEYLKNQLKLFKEGASEQLSYVEERLEAKDSSLETMKLNYELELDKYKKLCSDKDCYIEELLEKPANILNKN